MERSCTLLLSMGKGVPPSKTEIQADLESGKPEKQIGAMKNLIALMLNGDSLGGLLMTVIRYVALSPDHQLKKLACLYYETVDKYGTDGKLLPEAILICNALLKNLQHPNEFIRAYTLRFMCRIKEAELLEPLVAAIKENLDHRMPIVRRVAVMAVFQIWKSFGDDLIPDADELIERFLLNETDAGARRNAFLMLYQTSQEKAIEYFSKNVDNVYKFGDGFQLIILELTRHVCRQDPSQKSRFIKTIFQLLQSSSSSVCFEAAWTLVSLSAAPTAVRSAVRTYTQLLNAESDNNVKLIVLDKLGAMRKHHSKILQENLMDILRALSSPNSNIRCKTLDIVMDLITPRNVSEVTLALKKEILKTQIKDMDKEVAAEYRTMLVKAIHSCAIKFASIADNVVHLLMDFLGSDSGQDVAVFIREIVQTYPHMSPGVIRKLAEVFSEIRFAQVYQTALWVLGEYSDSEELRSVAFNAICDCLGELPFVKYGNVEKINIDEIEMGMSQSTSTPTARVKILADGTYATQTAFDMSTKSDYEEDCTTMIRKLMLDGNYVLGASAIFALTRLVLRSVAAKGATDSEVKEDVIKVVMIGLGVIHAGRLGKGSLQIDKESYERISLCLRILLDPELQEMMGPMLLNGCRDAFAAMLETERRVEKENSAELANVVLSQPDSLIPFRQLKVRRELGADDIDMDDEASLRLITGSTKGQFTEDLARIYQLTGFSDPVYAEAHITVHDYDIVLDIIVINRTASTLSNLSVELNSIGDLKLVERPQSYNIGSHSHCRLKANIKVCSTEAGQIFGTIVYDSVKNAETTVINLNEIPVDIMDYIHPATCSDAAFRQMWAEFEWENKVCVNTEITDVDDFLDHIIDSTKMNCLTPRFTRGENDFLASNLYAKSVFGEDALVNVSVEKIDLKVEGNVRIRAKTQGIALSIGDRITAVQKARI